MNDHLTFPTGKLEDFESCLRQLGARLSGIRQSIEYIQDYINTYGLKMWQEELSRIVNYNVEQECNEFLKKKVYDWQSEYQSEAIPIPLFDRPKHPDQAKFANFTGRVVNELLRHSSPLTSIYAPFKQGWFSLNDNKETVCL